MNHMMLKYFLSSITNFHSSWDTSFEKCSFNRSIDFLESIETNISVYWKCRPDKILESPDNDIPTEPFFFLASGIFLWLCSILSTTPNRSCLSPFFSFYLYTQMGVPIFNTPLSTSTPKTMGSLLWIVFTCFKIHGNTAYFPYFYFLACFIAATCLLKKSVKW